MTVVIVALDGDPQWADFDIPGGNMPVRMALLRKEADTRARTLFVAFPDGWERAGPGFYEAGEEVIIVSGALELNGETLRPHDHAIVPARCVRTGMRAIGEVIAFARFDGPARYVDGVVGADDSTMTSRTIAGYGELHRTAIERSWIGAPPAAPLPYDVEIFELSSHRWSFVEAGFAPPTFDGPCFLRTTDTRGL